MQRGLGVTAATSHRERDARDDGHDETVTPRRPPIHLRG